jgi:predicted nucleotidyltransferase component of viral defense system
MLHYETIDASTLELLKALLHKEIFREVRLVGGTALALQLGHRRSIDLDLFGTFTADELTLSEELKTIGEITVLKKTPRIYVYSINGVKLDLVSYPYPWIEELIEQDDLRLAHPKDIGAMKLAAITGRGTKKDFFDLYFLLQRYELADLLFFYNQKFSDGSEFLVLKSLIYFEDAEADPDPVMLLPVSWSQVKKRVIEKHVAYLRGLK